MKNKGFSLIELIIVIAILAIIMMIGTVGYAKIMERMRVRSDKATAGQVGKALVVRETDVGRDRGIPYYPTLTVYDSLDGIEKYISKGTKPQSMPDGNFIATAIHTDSGKKIIVGIGKIDEGIEPEVYHSSKKSGWAWNEDEEINKFLHKHKEELKNEDNSGGNTNENTLVITSSNGPAISGYFLLEMGSSITLMADSSSSDEVAWSTESNSVTLSDTIGDSITVTSNQTLRGIVTIKVQCGNISKDISILVYNYIFNAANNPDVKFEIYLDSGCDNLHSSYSGTWYCATNNGNLIYHALSSSGVKIGNKYVESCSDSNWESVR